MLSALRMENIAYDYAGERALRGVSLVVQSGALFGIIGADGAGKSTLFRILATLLPLQEGSAQILGMDVKTDPRRIRSTIGYMPQRFSLYPDLTVLENLRFAADIMDIPQKETKGRIEELIAFSRLEKSLQRRAGRLSGGMKQKLALCCAMVRSPKVLILDEPTVGVDPVTRKDFWEMLGVLKSHGCTTIVSTPYMDEAEHCDEILLMHQGCVLGQGAPPALCAPLRGRLWAIHGDTTLHVRTDTPVPPPLEGLYAMGGDLHAVAPEGGVPQEILRAVQSICAEAREIHAAVPRVEDVLLQTLRRESYQ